MSKNKIEVKKLESVGIHERVMNIQQEAGEVAKLGENTFHHYTYAREGDIIAEVKPLLGKYKLAVTFNVISEEIVGELTKAWVAFRLVAVDTGEYINTRILGYGADKGDKGLPKALTMATKYYLSKMFLIETGNDAEDDKQDRRSAAPAKGKKPETKATEELSNTEVSSKFEIAMTSIKGSKNVGGLIEYSEKLKSKKTIFSEEQVAELQAAVTKRVNEIENGKEKDGKK